MPREFPRSRRVEEQIQRILSDLLRSGVRDPRLKNVIVTAVKVSRDLGVAWVYVTALSAGDAARPDIVGALEHAAGYLRSALAGELTVRQVPELRFRLDDTLEQAEHMDELIARAVAADRTPEGEQGPAGGGADD